MRHRRAWARRLRLLLLPACVLALAVPASAHAAPRQDLRSPDARDAARDVPPAQAQAQGEPGPVRSTKVIERTGSGDQTVALVLASTAIGIALAGLAVALGALLRRPRSRWSVS
jgi:hypothetical protein